MIRTKTFARYRVFNKGINKAANVSARLPHLGIHQNCSIKPVHIFATVYKQLPPLTLDVVIEGDTKWTQVPCTLQAAVNPPSTAIAAPVMNPAASDSRKAASSATS